MLGEIFQPNQASSVMEEFMKHQNELIARAPSRPARRLSRGTTWSRAVALAGVLSFALLGGEAKASVSPSGEVAGLQAKFVDVNGIRTRYYEMGQGEVLVLVHGEGWSGHSSANAWSKNIPGFAKKFHVFAPDKTGSGMTDNPRDDKDFNLQGEIDHIYQFIVTMKLGKVHLVGQSHGAADILFLALEHPEVVRTLVLCDSNTAAPVGPPTTRQEALAHCPKEPDAEEWKCRIQAITARPDLAFDDEYFAAGKYMAGLPKAQETVAKVKAGAGAPLYDMRPNSGFPQWKTAWLERVKNEGILQVPVLLYWGRNDPSAVIANGWALYDVLAEKNPKVRMITVNKAGHFHFREYPEEFDYNVINFINYWQTEP
jgi:2-hydroxy-6-oxonona-2,4-dienedioate hydrolase